MYTIASSSPSPAAQQGARRPSATPSRLRWRASGRRGLAALLLAGAVAALVVLADRLIGTWADSHLFMAWVALWVVVFAGLALFADTARMLARRTGLALDGWSRAVAQRRAEARLWAIAQSDSRIMADLTRARDRSDLTETDFSHALAPLGMENAGSALPNGGWGGFRSAWLKAVRSTSTSTTSERPFPSV